MVTQSLVYYMLFWLLDVMVTQSLVYYRLFWLLEF